MGKTKVNDELLTIMDEYVSFLDSDKYVSMPMHITKVKPFHKQSLYIEVPLSSVVPFGHTIMDCEIRQKNPQNYSFQLLTDKFEKRVVTRLDEGNGTHRNNLPDIPLAQQEVTTPHFHKYDNNGCFFAYHTAELKAYVGVPLPIEKGLELFCSENNIHPEVGQEIGIDINEEETIPFEIEEDPLNGINFS